MQLRVARLCLDCEELHADNSCPRCASERYAFLSAWLPSEERRKWRRPASQPRPSEETWALRRLPGLIRSLRDWLSGDHSHKGELGPATRASDAAARLNFDKAPAEPATSSRLKVHLPKHDAR